MSYIISSPDGYFSAAITSAYRKRFSSQDMKGGSLEEKASAADSYISYCGPCEVEEDMFRTKVEVSLFPNWVGEYEERYYRIKAELSQFGPIQSLSAEKSPRLM